jgi:hypothetical protein
LKHKYKIYKSYKREKKTKQEKKRRRKKQKRAWGDKEAQPRIQPTAHLPSLPEPVHISSFPR